MGKRFIYFAALLFCTACTSDSYYVQQARIYKEITQMVETASTIEEVDSLNITIAAGVGMYLFTQR